MKHLSKLIKPMKCLNFIYTKMSSQYGRKITITLLITVALCLLLPHTAYAAGPTDNLDISGEKILHIIQKVAYWIILIKCISELIKAALHGEIHSIGKIVMTYTLIYASVFFVPWLLVFVQGIF